MEQSLYMALMISHYVQTGIEVKMGTLVKSGCVDTPYIWVPCKCGVYYYIRELFSSYYMRYVVIHIHTLAEIKSQLWR